MLLPYFAMHIRGYRFWYSLRASHLEDPYLSKFDGSGPITGMGVDAMVICSTYGLLICAATLVLSLFNEVRSMGPWNHAKGPWSGL